MGQVTIYVDEKTEKKMQRMVEDSGVSKSKWVTMLIREKTENSWPEDVRRLAGAWKDFPTVEELKDGTGEDASREPV